MIPSIIAHNVPEQTRSTDLVCPDCHATPTFSSAARRVTCPACGLVIPLTDAQHTDLVFALIGVDPSLNIPAFLHAVCAEVTA